jgi:hypothetical protein
MSNLKELIESNKSVSSILYGIAEAKAYTKASNNELAQYSINLQDEVKHYKQKGDKKNELASKRDLEEVRAELSSRKKPVKEASSGFGVGDNVVVFKGKKKGFISKIKTVYEIKLDKGGKMTTEEGDFYNNEE